MAPSSDDQTNLNDSVSAKQAPVTHARPVATDAGAHIQQPGVSRANYTVSQTKSGLRSKYHEENKDYVRCSPERLGDCRKRLFDAD